MVGKYLLSITSTFSNFNSRLEAWEAKIRENFLNWFYRGLPTERGKLDAELESNIKEGVLYVGVRLRTFNEVVGKFVDLATILFLVSLLSAIPLVFFTPTSPVGTLGLIADVIILLIGLMIVIAMGLVGIANLLLILYTASLLRYGLKRIQSSTKVTQSKEPDIYTCLKHNSKGLDQSHIQVYKENLESAFRLFSYSIFILLASIPLIFSSKLDGTFKSLLIFLPMQKLSNHQLYSGIRSIMHVVDAILPINVFVLFKPNNIYSLTVILICFLVFSVFMNWKRISQHSIESQYEWTDYESFSWKKECKRCFGIAKVAFYQLLHGGLTREFSVIRGQVIRSAQILLVDLFFTFFYLYILLNM